MISSTQKKQPIPLVDLQTQSQQIRDEVLDRMADVINSARYILGKEVGEFETAFAEYCKSKHSIGVANGTEALHLALRALDVGPGDEVITAGNSFAATAFAIAHTGATAVFVDVDETTYNIDVNLLEEAITEKTKAIIPVHLYGQPANMHPLLAIAKKHNLRVVEDSAQGHGAELAGQRCGSFGDLACFSFYPGKNLGAFGDGGAIVTQDEALAEKVHLLRNYGQRVKNEHDMLGYNSRLDTLQACVLLTKLNHIEAWTESRRQVAGWYREALAGIPDLLLPQEMDDVRHVYHLFVVQHPSRDQLLEHLKSQEIFCGIHYPNPLHRAKPLADSRTYPENLPVTCHLADRILSLPMYPEMTQEQVSRVAEAIRDFS